MKRVVSAFAVAFACSMSAWASTPATLTTLSQIHVLTNAQAIHALPVAFQATVIYFRGYEKTMFVQDGGVAIYVQATTNAKLVPGDRILIKGTTHESFRPFVLSHDIALLGHGPVPSPVPVGFDQLIRAERDCMLVSVRAKVRAVDLVMSTGVLSTNLQLLTDGGAIEATVDSGSPGFYDGLLDAEVEIVGADSGKFDGKMQQTGVQIHITSFADVKVLARASSSPLSLPVTPMDEVLTGYHVQILSQRIRVQGVITYYQPGAAIVLQNGSKSLWIQTHTIAPMHVGEFADVTGFPGIHDGFLTLTNGQIQASRAQAPIAPQPATWRQLAMSGNVFDLVSIEGQVVTEVREAAQDEYVLTADGQMFSAIYRHPPSTGLIPEPPPPMREIPIGAKIRVTGICILDDSNPFNAQVPFNILLRAANDIEVVAQPSWLNIRNLIVLIGVLIVVVFIVGLRGWAIEHRTRRQTAALAYIERRRSRILEDINGSRPLAEILEQITELVSFKVHGAPCWCQVTDGAQLGNIPPRLNGMRVARQEIPARSGPPLGTLLAAFDAKAKPQPGEDEALSRAAGLASLAIETRRLYTDLLHRSEFDLLTGVHNRFSLEKYLDGQIELARETAGIFGLIYIDLDGFKQINDIYGHKVGDLYLQEVTLRMKGQLRSMDALARLGGDEFAALIPVGRGRADVEEIANRLERSFDEPFAVQGNFLCGSASVGIALYPADGSSKDSLLNAADAAMYVAKNIKHAIRLNANSPHIPAPAGA